MGRVSDHINRLPGNLPVSAGGTVSMKEAINRARKMGSSIPKTTTEFIDILQLKIHVKEAMLQRYSNTPLGAIRWDAQHQRLQLIPNIGPKTEKRIEALLKHVKPIDPEGWTQEGKPLGNPGAIRPTPGEEPNPEQHYEHPSLSEELANKTTRLLALMVEVIGTSLGVQKQFSNTVERLERLLAEQAERVEDWNATEHPQEAAQGTPLEADAMQGQQRDQPPSVAQQFRTGAPTFQPDEDDDPLPHNTPDEDDTADAAQQSSVPSARKQHDNRVLLWQLAKEWNWHRGAVQMMCKSLSKDQDPQRLSTYTWDSIIYTLKDEQSITHWHQQLADQG